MAENEVRELTKRALDAEARVVELEAALTRLVVWPESTPEHPSITSQDGPMRAFALQALHPIRKEKGQCECGANDYCVSATLIACRTCGRTWGRCNGKWVLDTATVPNEEVSNG